MAPVPITARYILQQIMRPLAGALAVGLMVLLAERMVRLLDVTLGKRNSFSLVFEMLAYLVPHYLGLAIPAAFFLGLLFGFSKLSSDSEVDAFMASGIGLHQLAKPVLGLALVFAMLATLIISHVQPHTRYAYRALLHTVRNVEIFYLAEEGVFMRAGTRTFILDKLSRGSSEFEHIFLFEDKGKLGSQTITARSGALIEVEGEPRPVLRLESGHRLEIKGWPEFGGAAPLPQPTVGEFSLVDTPLGTVSDTLFRKRGTDQRELTLPELFERRDGPPAGVSKDAMSAEIHRRLIGIVTILVLPILAIPFSLSRRRGQKPYRFATALIILIAFHEIVEQGALMVRYGSVSPYLALWLPFALLLTFALWRYYRTCFTLRPDGLEPIFDRLNDTVSWAIRRLVGKRRAV